MVAESPEERERESLETDETAFERAVETESEERHDAAERVGDELLDEPAP